MLDLAEFLILRLKLFRKLFSFNERRVLELDLPHSPLFPALSWIDHRILVYFFFLLQKIGHVLNLNSFLELLNEDLIVDVSVVIVGSDLLVFFRCSKLFVFDSFKNQKSDLIKTRQDCIF